MTTLFLILKKPLLPTKVICYFTLCFNNPQVLSQDLLQMKLAMKPIQYLFLFFIRHFQVLFNYGMKFVISYQEQKINGFVCASSFHYPKFLVFPGFMMIKKEQVLASPSPFLDDQSNFSMAHVRIYFSKCIPLLSLPQTIMILFHINFATYPLRQQKKSNRQIRLIETKCLALY